MRKGEVNGFVNAGLAALGGAGGYYYHNSSQSVKKAEAVQAKTESVDYNQVYKEIAELLEENPE